jgi:hypothetical protein
MLTNSIAIPIAICAIQTLIICGVLAMRYHTNKSLFKSVRNLRPVRSGYSLINAHAPLFDLLDRIPFIRRSGQGNEIDYMKAFGLTTLLVLAAEMLVLQPGLVTMLWLSNVALFLLCITMIAHPRLKAAGRRSAL